jgi:ATP-binding cassette, subfamily B, bacterial
MSGISGGPELEEPHMGERPRGLRSRWRSLRQTMTGTSAGLPKVLRLIWQASPWLTIGLGVVTVIAGLVPAASAAIARLLVNAVVDGIANHAAGRPDHALLTVPTPLFALRPPVTGTAGVIVLLIVLQLSLMTLNSLLSTIGSIAQQLLQERMTLRIQLLVMERAADLDLPFFEDAASYDLLRRAQQDAATRPVAMLSSTFSLARTAITFASMIALLVGVSPLLAVVALLSPIPAFVAETRYGLRSYKLARWASPLHRRMSYLSALVTTDTVAKEVKLYGLGGHFVQRFRRLANAYYERQRRLVTIRHVASFAWTSITTVASSGTYLFVALLAVAGRLTLGDLTLYTAAASAVQGSIQNLLDGLSGMYENNLYLSNLFELLSRRSAIARPQAPRPVPRPLRGEVEFEDVTFTYPGSRGPALHDLTFRIAGGETIAVVGRNGAGKTTLIKLLCRLYDPARGRILFDGIDIRDFDPDELRANIAAVFQDFVGYQATLAENIGLGDVRSIEDRTAIVEAARRAGAEELAAHLPRGYDTPLGRWFEGGVNLSGGEWQKVALSRAFMRDARILVLDEPTSALDAHAEHELFTRLRSLSSGRTALYISHRFSTVRRADRILFLEQGRLVEEGTHGRLMALDGRYADLFRAQASAFTGDVLDSSAAS